jgi:exodeoxyribonuclease V gamma subunit
MLERLHGLQLDDKLTVQDFSRPCGEIILEGRLTDLYPQGQFAFSVNQFYPHQLLGLWLRHLALCLAGPQGVNPRTFWLEAAEAGEFLPVDDPEAMLEPLLELYRQGLEAPLPFYPGTSWAYAERLLRSGDPAVAYQAAERKWLGNERYPGDAAKPYQHLLFPDGNLLDQEFLRISLAVFQPLIEHRESGA